MSTSKRKGDSSRISWEGKDITCRYGWDMDSGNKTSKNMPAPDQFFREPYKLITRTRVYGWSMLRWRWRTNLWIMPVMYGKEPFTTSPGRINFGSNMPIWSSWLGNIPKLAMYSQGGWNGVLEKKLGWPSLNFRKEWENQKMPKLFYISI